MSWISNALPNVDVASQLFGSKKGHEINMAVDSFIARPVEEIVEDIARALEPEAIAAAKTEAAAFFVSKGFTGDPAGAVAYGASVLAQAIENSAEISPTLKPLLAELIKSLANDVETIVPTSF